jgi:hypothetical protein
MAESSRLPRNFVRVRRSQQILAIKAEIAFIQDSGEDVSEE